VPCSVGGVDVPLHPDLGPVAFLLGTWEGEGRGSYPTIEPFGWRDTTRFWHVGKPTLLYEQRTKDIETGEPRHAESGFIRPGAQPGQIEMVVAHNTGHTELATGVVGGERIEVGATRVQGTDTAKQVVELQRVFDLSGDVLTVTLAMAAVGQPLTHHLEAELTKVTT